MAARVAILVAEDGVSSITIVGPDRAAGQRLLARIDRLVDCFAVCAATVLRDRVVDNPEGRDRVDAEVARLRAWADANAWRRQRAGWCSTAGRGCRSRWCGVEPLLRSGVTVTATSP